MFEIYENIYLQEISLKGNPLKSINIYIIKGEDRNAIIDTGFNTPEIIAETEKYIEKLELSPNNTDVILTHLHSDHTGLANYFDNLGYNIFIGKVDGTMVENMKLKNGPHWSNIVENAKRQGLYEDNLDIEDHPGFKFRPKESFRYTPLEVGDVITYGDFVFEIFDLSGHTPGMIGLYEEDKSILFCGDHILAKITPNIIFWGFDYGDSLGIYIENLKRVRDLNIKYLLSSHRFLIKDVETRVDELLLHHEKRLNDTREILKKYGASSVRTVTKNLHWDINAKSWEDFPKSQKWFAAGEAQSHLEHLRALNEVKYFIDESGIMYYHLV